MNSSIRVHFSTDIILYLSSYTHTSRTYLNLQLLNKNFNLKYKSKFQPSEKKFNFLHNPIHSTKREKSFGIQCACGSKAKLQPAVVKEAGFHASENDRVMIFEYTHIRTRRSNNAYNACAQSREDDEALAGGFFIDPRNIFFFVVSKRRVPTSTCVQLYIHLLM